MDEYIFNKDKRDYNKVPLVLGDDAPGLFDTVNKQYPKIWNLYKKQKELDWDENEFDYSSCVHDFKTCTEDTYDAMIKTLAWQWEADSVFSRAIAPVLAPFISSSELWAAWQKVSELEVCHSAAYSEIVRNSFDNPRDIINEILSVQKAHDRLKCVGEAFSNGYTASHLYALGDLPNNQQLYDTVMMMIVALYLGERVQFMSSFAVTFAICETGLFQPIGKVVQKICQDEFEVHSELDKEVLLHELSTERGKRFLVGKGEGIQALIEEVVQSEFEWSDYLFSEGRSVVGLNADILKKWTLFCVRDVVKTLDIKINHTLPSKNPLRFMEHWIDISLIQPSPQEQQIGMYKVNNMRRDDADEIFDF